MLVENAELKARVAELSAYCAAQAAATTACCPGMLCRGGNPAPRGGNPAPPTPGKRQRSLSPKPCGTDAAAFPQSLALRNIEKSPRTASLSSRASQPSSSSPPAAARAPGGGVVQPQLTIDLVLPACREQLEMVHRALAELPAGSADSERGKMLSRTGAELLQDPEQMKAGAVATETAVAAAGLSDASARLAIVGGYNGMTALGSLEVFDGRDWVSGPTMGIKRCDAGTVAIGGAV